MEHADHRKNLTRRRFIGASVGAAAGAWALGGLTSAARGGSGLLVPPGKRSIILFTVRDRISAAPDATGVPYGFERVLARLAEIGYHGIEFAGYNQSTQILGRQITPAEIRKALDDNGLVAVGSHGSIPSDLNNATQMNNHRIHMETAATLGQKYIGTGGDPTSSNYKADWGAAAECWNTLGEMAAANGLKLYTHNHSPAYNFLLDSGPLDDLGRPTRSSGIRKLEYFLGITNPELVHLEMDIHWAHVAQHQWRTYTAPDGRTQTNVFDPGALVAANSKQYPLFHAKDGARTEDPPGVGQGYVMVPLGAGDIDFTMFFANMGASGFHHPMYEQDNAPGGSADPGRRCGSPRGATRRWTRCEPELFPRDGRPTGARPCPAMRLRLPIFTASLATAMVVAYVGFQHGELTPGASRSIEFRCNAVEYGLVPYEVTHPGARVTDPYCEPQSESTHGDEEAHADEHARTDPGIVADAPTWLTPLTSTFMHSGLLHLAASVLALLIFGPRLERRVGSARFLGVFLVAGLASAGSADRADAGFPIAMIGATGGVAGVVGAHAVSWPRSRLSRSSCRR